MTIRKWRWAMLGGGLGIYLLGLGFLGGILTERVRWEPPSAPGHEGRDAPWITHLSRVEDALARRNVGAADMAWHDAYRAALKSRRWDGMIEVGEAYLRIGEATRGRKVSEARARELFLAALFRARQQGSLDGVLRTAEAFAALGDREVAEQGIYIAQRLAAQAQDTQVRERVNAAGERLAARFTRPESPNSTSPDHMQALIE